MATPTSAAVMLAVVKSVRMPRFEGFDAPAACRRRLQDRARIPQHGSDGPVGVDLVFFQMAFPEGIAVDRLEGAFVDVVFVGVPEDWTEAWEKE